MKTLLVMRHAKSDWSHPGLSDHDRPLNKRGHRDAPRMATFLTERFESLDLLLSSTAVRARTTAEAVAEAFGISVQPLPALYLVGDQTYFDLLAKHAGHASTVLTVSHNPGVEEIVERLSGAEEFMSTAAVAWLECDVDRWSDLGTGVATCRAVWRPKEVLGYM